MTGDLRRQLILSAAKRCFARYGFAGTTTKSIAAAASISEGLLFSSSRCSSARVNCVVAACRFTVVAVSELSARALAGDAVATLSTKLIARKTGEALAKALCKFFSPGNINLHPPNATPLWPQPRLHDSKFFKKFPIPIQGRRKPENQASKTYNFFYSLLNMMRPSGATSLWIACRLINASARRPEPGRK